MSFVSLLYISLFTPLMADSQCDSNVLKGNLNTSNFAWSATQEEFSAGIPDLELNTVESGNGMHYEATIPVNGSM